uniref:PQQ-binding-like beta-propeller repeat protein n=1 Tax=Micromonospora carbonacea TaxID=47853 RepID=A0A7D6CFA5_9ACTN|nr:PQQ-binding-like beta-propeller repeat protein [Micromonospora carbonacea]
MTLIDLGEVRGAATPASPPRPPRTVGRPLRVALAGLLALLALASSAPVVRPASAMLGGRLGSQVLVIGGRVYLLEPAQSGDAGGREVTVHALPADAGPAARPLWRTTVSGVGNLLGVQEYAGLVLFTGNRDGRDVQTLAVDAATGERRWQRPGDPVPTVGGGLLLVGDDIERRGELRAVEPSSGSVRWSLPDHLGVTTFHSRADDGAVDLVVLITAAGRIELRDALSGAVRASLAPPAGGRRGYLQVTVAGDLLLVGRHEQQQVLRLTAYGLANLDRRWELDRPPFGYAIECGPLLCAGAFPSGVSALDPATGQTRWANPRLQTVLAVHGDRLLAAVGGRPDAPIGTVRVLDAATGREVADLGRWEIVRSHTPGGPWYGVRPDRGGAGLVVAELDVAGATARLRDVLPGAAGDCAADGRDMVCRQQSGTYGWWRLPA